MRTTRRRSALAIAIVSGLLVGLAVSPAGASVTWTPGSISTVYIPTGPPGGGGAVQYYAYGPSVIESGSTLRLWTCHNTQSGVFHDDIFYTKIVAGTKTVDQSVLASSASGWDSFHVCDPTVIRVNARIGTATYTYAMFYTGNDLNASAHNQVGVAYANSLEGPWTKQGSPVVGFPCGADTSQWGAGQPSATTINPSQGTLLLFWTQGCGAGNTHTYRAQFDLDGASGPVMVGSALQVTDNGLLGHTGSADYLNGADFAYDPSRDRFYVTREMHPYPTSTPNFIGTTQQIVSIAGSSIWGGGGTWAVEGAIDPALTGYARNHNAGLVRNEFGTLVSSSALNVIFTSSCGGTGGTACSGTPEWTYRLHRVNGTI
jgi:hypothetical protein